MPPYTPLDEQDAESKHVTSSHRDQPRQSTGAVLLLTAWWLCVVCSIVTLTFYRSDAMNVPDGISKEMKAFLSPLFVCLIIVFAHAVVSRNGSLLSGRLVFSRKHLFGTVAISFIETIVYVFFVMQC